MLPLPPPAWWHLDRSIRSPPLASLPPTRDLAIRVVRLPRPACTPRTAPLSLLLRSKRCGSDSIRKNGLPRHQPHWGASLAPWLAPLLLEQRPTTQLQRLHDLLPRSSRRSRLFAIGLACAGLFSMVRRVRTESRLRTSIQNRGSPHRRFPQGPDPALIASPRRADATGSTPRAERVGMAAAVRAPRVHVRRPGG